MPVRLGTALVAPNRTRERGGGDVGVRGSVRRGRRRRREGVERREGGAGEEDKAAEEEDLTPEVFLARLRDVAGARAGRRAEEAGPPWPSAPGARRRASFGKTAVAVFRDEEDPEGGRMVPVGDRGGAVRTGGEKLPGGGDEDDRAARNTSPAPPLSVSGTVADALGWTAPPTRRRSRRSSWRSGRRTRPSRTNARAEARGCGAECTPRCRAPEPTGVRRRGGDARRTRAREAPATTEPETAPNKNKPGIVWVGTGFARVDEVAFTGALDRRRTSASYPRT